MTIWIPLPQTRGTGKLARWFERELPDGCQLWGVVRQQLLVDDAIPYTSHNSSACAVVDCPEEGFLSPIIAKAIEPSNVTSSPGATRVCA